MASTTAEPRLIRALLVDDNPGDVVLLCEMARRAAADIAFEHAETVAEALAMLADSAQDIVLLDLSLPDATGLESLHALRRGAPEVPVIVLTGNSSETLALQAVKDGAQDYLNKNHVDGHLLARTIRYSIERRRVQDLLAQQERQRRQTQKLEAIGQLAAGVAHEINTPMQYIGDNLRFLRESIAGLLPLLTAVRARVAGDAALAELRDAVAGADLEYVLDEIPKALAQSLDGVERVTKIVRAMKEFSHPGSAEKTPADLHRAIETTLTVCRNEWKYVADVETRFDPRLPAVPCYPSDFNQVILNLVVNAAHAIGEKLGRDAVDKGKITVSTRLDAGFAEIRVADTGTGIPEHVRDRIMEPFFTTKEVGKGTGQGLSVAFAIVAEKHGGTLDFESEVGKGTTFIIRLPLEASAQAGGGTP